MSATNNPQDAGNGGLPELRAPLEGAEIAQTRLRGLTADQLAQAVDENPARAHREMINTVQTHLNEEHRLRTQRNVFAARCEAKDQQITELLAEKDDLKDLVVHLSGQQRAASRDATPGSGPGRSPKMADPELLSNGKEPTFEQWLLRMKDKLSTNADHYNTEKLRVAYVNSRTKGEAARHILPRMKDDHPAKYRTAEEVFTHLAEMYEDPEKLQNAKKDFNALTMELCSSFQSFRTKFHHLAGESKLPASEWKDAFFFRLTDVMRPLVAASKHLPTFRDFELICIQVAPTLPPPAKKAEKKKVPWKTRQSGSGTQTTPASGSNDSPTRADRDKLYQEGRCYYCKETGHVKPQCPKLRAIDEKKKASALAALEIQNEDSDSESSKND
jgi:hypothetical protein